MEKLETIKEPNIINISYVHSDSQPSSCGYCKEDEIKKKTSYKIGFSCDNIHASDYEKLMFNSFRKCGTYYYKPNLEKSCCQLHSIRLNVDEFVISNNQRKIMRKLKRYLSGNITDNSNNKPDNSVDSIIVETESQLNKEESKNEFSEVEKIFEQVISFNPSILKLLKLFSIDLNICLGTENLMELEVKSVGKLSNYIIFNKGKNCYSCNLFNILYHKIISLDKQKKNNKNDVYQEVTVFLEGKNIYKDTENTDNNPNTDITNTDSSEKQLNLDEFRKFYLEKVLSIVESTNAIINNDVHDKFKIVSENLFVNVIKIKNLHKKEIKNKLNTSLELNEKDEKDSLDSTSIKVISKNDQIQKDPIYIFPYFKEIVEEPIVYMSNKFKEYKIILDDTGKSSKYCKEKFELFKKYQIAVHKDKESDLSLERYLDSWGNDGYMKSDYDKINLISSNEGVTDKLNLEKLTHYGAYNLLHFIADKLIAVSVIDILPMSTSSVYCYYDPDLSKKLSLGVVTAIREIEFTKLLQRKIKDSTMKYYFMGFYVQTCQKMAYKGDYYPSQVLCPVTKKFVYLNAFVRKLIDKSKKGCRLLFNKKTDEKLSEPGNEHLIQEVSKEKVDEIYKSLKIKYNNKIHNLAMFIENYIDIKYQSNLISSVNLLISSFGEELSSNKCLLFCIS